MIICLRNVVDVLGKGTKGPRALALAAGVDVRGALHPPLQGGVIQPRLGTRNDCIRNPDSDLRISYM